MAFDPATAKLSEFDPSSAKLVEDAPKKELKALTKEPSNAIDRFLIEKLSQQPGLGLVPDIQGSKGGRFIQGMADLPVGAMQLGMNLVGAGDKINPQLKDINARTEQLRGPNAGFDWMRLGGNMLNPATIGILSKVPMAADRMAKIGQGIGIGAAAGALSPVTTGDNFAAEKGQQIASGATLGGIIPAIAPLVTIPAKAGYHGLIEPWLNPAAIKGRAYLEAAGTKAKDIIDLLRENKQIVPGSRPTAGEAAVPAGSAEFSAFAKAAGETRPSDYVARADEQNAARLGQIRTVGQTPEALSSAESARKVATDPLYAATREGATPVDTTEIVKNVRDILTKNPGNRELVSELTNVQKGLVDAEGNLRTNPQEVGSVIDGLKASIANKDNAFIKGRLSQIKEQLTKAIPGYTEAQAKFSEMSKPVNQMQVGQYLEGKLIPALSEDAKQKATVYSGALRDAPGTIKRATGSPRFQELSQVLDENQLAAVNSVRDDLARGARFTDLARAGAKAAPDAAGPVGNHKLTGMFSREVTIANAIIGRLEGKINKTLAAEIAVEMLNPPKVADSLEKAAANAAANKVRADNLAKWLRYGTASGLVAGERK